MVSLLSISNPDRLRVIPSPLLFHLQISRLIIIWGRFFKDSRFSLWDADADFCRNDDDPIKLRGRNRDEKRENERENSVCDGRWKWKERQSTEKMKNVWLEDSLFLPHIEVCVNLEKSHFLSVSVSFLSESSKSHISHKWERQTVYLPKSYNSQTKYIQSFIVRSEKVSSIFPCFCLPRDVIFLSPSVASLVCDLAWLGPSLTHTFCVLRHFPVFSLGGFNARSISFSVFSKCMCVSHIQHFSSEIL